VLAERSIVDVARTLYGEKAAPLVVVDFMSSPDAIRSLARVVPVALGISVGLSNDRSSFAPSDVEQGILHIAGDLCDISTYSTILKRLNGQHVDLVLERGEGGLSYIPNVRGYYELSLNAILRMMRPGAEAFLQLSGTCLGLPGETALVKAMEEQGVGIRYGFDSTTFGPVARLKKTEDTSRLVRIPKAAPSRDDWY
jgi:hypothetical protein